MGVSSITDTKLTVKLLVAVDSATTDNFSIPAMTILGATFSTIKKKYNYK
ncbi:hypothetical protein [Sporosarcina sp. FSL K6-5500]